MKYGTLCSILLLGGVCLHWILSQGVGSPHLQAAVARKLAIVALRREPPKVHLKCGAVEGAWEDGLAAFRGIPYGAAPVGERRWMPPVEAECWAPSVLRVTADGNKCYQGGQKLHESEDCLNLNVFATADHYRTHVIDGDVAEPAAVIVWIYGGSNVVGSVQSYGSIENIVRDSTGKVLMVAMNYRLNIFGFLALRELSERDPRGVSGNYGIMDQQLALKWVQQNIHAFGGDPHRVTLLGQSSGGTNILALLASRSSIGLFHSAISLSGSPNITMDLRTKETWDKNLVLASTPCAERQDVTSCLLSMETHEIWKSMPASYGLFDTFYDYPNTTDKLGIGSRVRPLVFVDGVTVEMPVEDALRQGLVDVPFILQSVQGEDDFYPEPSLFNLTDQGLHDFFQAQFLPVFGESASREIEARYKSYTSDHVEYAAYALAGDMAMACGNRRLALAAKKGLKSPVYFSVVTASPTSALYDPHGMQRLFPYHSWDFDAASRTAWEGSQRQRGKRTWTSTRQTMAGPPTESDLRFGRLNLDSWVQLASARQLNGSSWRPVQDAAVSNQLYGCLVDVDSVVPVLDLKADICAFWESLGVGQQWWWVN